jgi:hypothetical protein
MNVNFYKLQKLIFWPLFAAASFAVIVSRRPSSLTNPQFWAEDGRNWYADAYNHGVFYSLTTPEAGYFQTFSRLTAIASQLLPLEFGPLFFYLVAVWVQVIVAAFIASERLADLLPEKKWRFALAFGYLAMPHSWEIYANVTNSQWHLALLGCLILAARPPERRAAAYFDIAAVAIMAVSGPFCLFLAPIAAGLYLFTRERRLRPILALAAAGAVLQAIALLSFERPIQPELGASVDSFAGIFARHLAISPILGSRGFSRLAETPFYSSTIAYIAAGLVIAVFAFMLLHGLRSNGTPLRRRPTLQILSAFSILTVAAALISPAVSPEPGQWAFIAANDTAIRYWFIPTFTIYAGILRLLSMPNSRPLPKIIGAALAIAAFGGIIADWRLPRLTDYRFQEYAAEFRRLPAGSVFEIPINPNWKMTLVKK